MRCSKALAAVPHTMRMRSIFSRSPAAAEALAAFVELLAWVKREEWKILRRQ